MINKQWVTGGLRGMSVNVQPSRAECKHGYLADSHDAEIFAIPVTSAGHFTIQRREAGQAPFMELALI